MRALLAYGPGAGLLALAMVTIAPSPAGGQAAQATSGAWDDARARALMEEARARRAAPRADSALVNYQAQAAGHVYFFLDREDTEERTLVKVDQLALEVFWGTPDRTKQRIVGMRDETRLPSNIYYHLDHLTVVQDEFGDVIRLGDGDEVTDVPHPAAPGSDTIYAFRLADSLSISLAGRAEPIRVYEVQVRPRRVERPGFVGSVFLERGSAAIVRMSFTFTPASYVDPRLDYIRITLDNALWEGRYWLPNEQKLEIRRQYPGLDFPAGAVIRGDLRIRGYVFNQDLPAGFFRGPAVVAYPESMREAYPFEEGLYAGLEDAGLARPPELERLRETARELVGQRYLSGLPRLRLYAPDAASALRWNRAEGLVLGAGVAYAPGPAMRAAVFAGYGFGRERAHGLLALEHARPAGWGGELRLYRERVRDLGPLPGAPPAVNSLHALLGEDYLDPYFADGGEVRLERRAPGAWRPSLALLVEEHRSAFRVVEGAPLPLAGDEELRPVRAVPEGRLTSLALGLDRQAPGGARRAWWGGASAAGSRFDGAGFVSATVSGGLRLEDDGRRRGMRVEAVLAATSGEAPPQRLLYLGGRGTLPGWPYRGFVGDRLALLRAEADAEVAGPWLRLRVLGAAGWTGLRDAPAPDGWSVAESGGVRASAGVGLGLVHDVLRIDGVRGLGDGGWETVVTISPRLTDLL